MSEPHSSFTSFDSLNLEPALAQGIRDAGFVNCTPIQAQTLPVALAGKDVAGQAQTGTGKTAAFLIALYQTLLKNPPSTQRSPNSVRALIVAPTRELAVQIHSDAEILGKHTGFRHAVVFGGVDYEKQRRQVAEGVDVLIGTPGRLIDYMKQRVFDLRHAQVLVLDEADRMFDLGFIADIRYILRRLPSPHHRLSMLFSATLSHRVLELAYEHMNVSEIEHTMLHEVDQPARRADQHVHTLRDLPALLLIVDAPEHDGVPETGMFTEYFGITMDLHCELARWCDDERANRVRAALRRGRVLQKRLIERDQERRGLAGARLRLSGNIFAGKCHGQRLRLNGCAIDEAGIAYSLRERGFEV
jgi:ATP-dependent RNA helicase RhlB